jgi:hypothetical protein
VCVCVVAGARRARVPACIAGEWGELEACSHAHHRECEAAEAWSRLDSPVIRSSYLVEELHDDLTQSSTTNGIKKGNTTEFWLIPHARALRAAHALHRCNLAQPNGPCAHLQRAMNPCAQSNAAGGEAEIRWRSNRGHDF